MLQRVKSTWYGSISFVIYSNWLSVLCVKACVGGPPHQPSWGCSQLCRPLWGNQTLPTIHWQRSLADDISDSFGSAHSCRNRSVCVIITVSVCSYHEWLKLLMIYSAKQEWLKLNQARSIILPLINALLTEAVCAGQNKVGLSVHADTALLLIGQLLHSAWTHKQKRPKVLTVF